MSASFGGAGAGRNVERPDDSLRQHDLVQVLRVLLSPVLPDAPVFTMAYSKDNALRQ
jgi:hypothetical protein